MSVLEVTYYAANAVDPDSGFTGMNIQLDADPIWVNTGDSLRGHEWQYTLGANSATGIALDGARECDATMDCIDYAAWDRARRAFDADLRAMRDNDSADPGTLIVRYDPVGGTPTQWTVKALMVKAEPQQISASGHVRAKLTFLLLGWWHHQLDWQHFTPKATTGKWLDLPTDMPFDLMPRLARTVHNPASAPMPFLMKMHGPAVNPGINFGTNFYQVLITLDERETIEIDSVDGQRSVILRGSDGLTTTDIFDKAVRGGGLGSGNYIFEPIPPGDTTITWWGDYELDVAIVEEDSEPPWSI
ncbi:hypothetical protein [Bifidobacterium tissieri]|uniref:hypothetical protein n=1 Tax=Bifidobacterium tissieri TaxID=1630162 RepID=UPI0012389740|nr:hypothetical protein [Bifidobacterium tissieri]KAA8832618.1 hypothetical protein EM849_03690 [Bifidobacterium tissieri]